MARLVFGVDHKGHWTRYSLIDDARTDGGTEGRVHPLGAPHRTSCIKEFHTSEIACEKFEKLSEMVSGSISGKNLSVKDHLNVLWPTELVFSLQSPTAAHFLGYVMPLSRAAHPLDAIIRQTDKFAETIGLYERLEIARDIAALFALCHKQGIVIGDARPENIRIDRGGALPWRVDLIDVDSFQFSQGSVLFTSDMGDPNYASPRIQQTTSGVSTLTLRGLERTVDDDNFSLSVIIFQLLLFWHPFKNRRGTRISDNIASLAFSFESSGVVANRNAPLKKYQHLPKGIRELFKTTFLDDRPVSAQSWVGSLAQVLKSMPRPAKPSPAAPTPRPSVAFAVPHPAPQPRPPSPLPPPSPSPPPQSKPIPVGAIIGWIVGVVILLNVVSCVSGFFRDISQPSPQPQPVNSAPRPEPYVRPEPYSPPYYANPSFPCSGDLSWEQRAICSDESLAAQDRELAQLRQRVLVYADAQEVRRINDRWTEEWDRCGGSGSIPGCLSWVYREWINALRNLRPAEAPQVSTPEGGSTQFDSRQPAREPPTPRSNPDQSGGQSLPRAETRNLVTCILPQGQEVQLSLDQCRERAGVIYQ
jgi:serine/threonine protein kinase